MDGRSWWMLLRVSMLVGASMIPPATAGTVDEPKKPAVGDVNPPAPGTETPAAPAPDKGALEKTAPAAPAPLVGKAIAARPIALPGGGPDGVMMDYLAFDPASKTVWVPAGNTGSVDVIDAGSAKVTRVQGFPTAEVERRGRKRTVGPSSASPGRGVVFVGNRANSSVCAVDGKTMAAPASGSCVVLESMPDGVSYVAPAREVWVTTPRDETLTILDASVPGKLTVKTTIKLPGSPEGYAVDEARGIFYTNLEDKDRTLAIDVKSRAVKATWSPGCGEEGPRGLAIDTEQGLLVVACTDHLVVLDTAKDGAVRSHLTTGAGVDNIAYLASKRQVYAAAGQAAILTIARLGKDGSLTAVASGRTAEGARVVVTDDRGGAWVADSRGGRILYFQAP